MIHRFNQGAAALAGIALLLMVATTAALVLLRYGFGLSSIAVQEAVMYLHALLVCFGLAATWQNNAHVRIDIFYRRWSPQRQLLLDRLGIVLLALPFFAFVLWACWDYVAQAWVRREVSAEASGLPWLWLLKTLLLVFPAQLILAALLLFRTGTDNRPAEPGA